MCWAHLRQRLGWRREGEEEQVSSDGGPGGRGLRRESEHPSVWDAADGECDAVTRTGLTVDLLQRDPGDLDKSCSPKAAWVGSWESGSASGKRADSLRRGFEDLSCKGKERNGIARE